jgi:hypothetical protein
MMMLPLKSSVIAALLVLVVAATTAVFASHGWNECSEMWVKPGWHPEQLPGAVAVCSEGHIAISYDTRMSLPAFSAYYITPERMRQPKIDSTQWYYDPDLEQMGVAQRTHLPQAQEFRKTWQRKVGAGASAKTPRRPSGAPTCPVGSAPGRRPKHA